ncbi:MAG: ABC transporter permease [Elusimicrobiota bacterium]
MNLGESVRIARKNLSANRMRSALSMLGIVIGIASATVVTAVSNGIRLAVLESMSDVGTNVLQIYPVTDENGRTGTTDLDGIRRIEKLPFVEAAFPQVVYAGSARGAIASAQMNGRGVLARYLDVYKIPVVAGRALNEGDMQGRALTCVLNAASARRLFGAANPVGQTIRFGNATYEVVGLVGNSRHPSGAGRAADDLYIPLSTILRQENVALSVVEVWVRKEFTGDPKADILAAIAGDPREESLYSIQDPKALVEEVESTSRKFRYTMLALSAVALIVGGIGIMNVMLISVSERTREIGLRKALGASAKDILLQFVVEVSVLSAVGGLGGVLLGVGAAKLAPQLTNGEMPTAVMPSAVATALLFSVLVGLVFGLYPALKASRFSPMEALRND